MDFSFLKLFRLDVESVKVWSLQQIITLRSVDMKKVSIIGEMWNISFLSSAGWKYVNVLYLSLGSNISDPVTQFWSDQVILAPAHAILLR